MKYIFLQLSDKLIKLVYANTFEELAANPRAIYLGKSASADIDKDVIAMLKAGILVIWQ